MDKSYLRLSRRERHIMDALYQRGEATAAELESSIPNPPTNAAVRAKLRVLEEKGYVTHVQEGPRYLYRPVLREEQASQTALTHLIETFFEDSVERTVAALLRLKKNDLSEVELDRLTQLIDRSRGKSEG